MLLVGGSAGAKTTPKTIWAESCADRIRAAKARLSAHDAFFRDASVQVIRGLETITGGGSPEQYDLVSFLSNKGILYHAAVGAGPAERYGVTTGWAEFGNSRSLRLERHRFGSSGRIDVAKGSPNERVFIEFLSKALDECLAEAPAMPPTEDSNGKLGYVGKCAGQGYSGELLLACRAAERAARQLEMMVDWNDDIVPAGRGGAALKRIVAAGKLTTPILARLSLSPNPVARIASAVGFGEVRTPEGRRVLERLTHDQTTAAWDGLGPGGRRSVQSFAIESLTKYE
jgi:hypothetical protein